MTGGIVVSPIAAAEGSMLRRLPFDEWPPAMLTAKLPPFEVWLSREFLVQLFREERAVRISVNRTKFDVDANRWLDGISWDELQRLKFECGRGDQWAVELYPAMTREVNVANMRHLWLLPGPPAFGWNQGCDIPTDLIGADVTPPGIVRYRASK